MANLGPVKEDDIFELEEGTHSDGVVQNTDDDAQTQPPAETPPSNQDTVDDGGEDSGKTAPAKPEKPANPAASAPDGYVPHQALHEQRLANQRLKEQLDETQRKLGVVDTLRTQIEDLRNKNKPQDPDDIPPNKDTDPLAYVEWQNKQLQKKIDNLASKQEGNDKQTKEQAAAQQKLREIMTTVSSQVMEFEKVQPDYSDAFMYVAQKRMKEYAAMGYNPEECNQAFDREVMQLAVSSLQRDRNPGEVMYNLAKAQGYTKKAGDPPPPKDDAGLSLKDHMDRLEKGQQAGSMGSGSAPADDGVSIAAIDSMTDAEFDAFWEKNFGGSSIY